MLHPTLWALSTRVAGNPGAVSFAQVPQTPYGRAAGFDASPDVVVRRMGEFTCVVHAGAHVREATAHALEQLAATAAVDGYRDFVFDLTRVGRYETPALRSVADLWRRLAGLDCEVFVAARNPGVVDCLHRVIPARGKWTLQPTVADALQALLARPV
jgi:anti-anti-sigma regulatory factor